MLSRHSSNKTSSNSSLQIQLMNYNDIPEEKLFCHLASRSGKAITEEMANYKFN